MAPEHLSPSLQYAARGLGRLFGDRYKAVLVEGGGYYYETLLDYLHLNPVRAGLVDVARGESVRQYPWSSVALGYALPPGRRPPWLAVETGLAALGCADTTAGRRRFVERLDRRAQTESREGCGLPTLGAKVDRRRSHLRDGWFWGSQGFAERVLAAARQLLGSKRHRNYRASGESRARGEEAALDLLGIGLARVGLTMQTLALLPGSDARKVALARQLRRQTTVSLSWIADQLKMKSAANVSQQIRRHGK